MPVVQDISITLQNIRSSKLDQSQLYETELEKLRKTIGDFERRQMQQQAELVHARLDRAKATHEKALVVSALAQYKEKGHVLESSLKELG